VQQSPVRAWLSIQPESRLRITVISVSNENGLVM
jgi:hypothetical protein